MAKLVFKNGLDVSKDDAIIQLEGIYQTEVPPEDDKDKTKAGTAYTYEDGGLHWEKINQQAIVELVNTLKVEYNYGGRYVITPDLKWKQQSDKTTK